jgi:beta-lactamase regulating signal transducer with metallopeptidase domain
VDGFAASGILGLLAEYALKTTVVLTLVLLAVAVSRRRPAAFRHFLLSFALIGLLLLPVLSLAPVGWRTSLLPSRPTVTMGQSHANDAQISGLEAVAVPIVTLSMTAGSPDEGPSELPASAAELRPLESSAPSLSGPPPSDHRAGPASALTRSVLGGTLAVLWLAGLVVLVLRLAFGLAGAARLTAQGTALRDPAWRVLFERFLSLVSLRRRIDLRSHPEVLVPLTWGWRKPVILMPPGAGVWTEEERSSALFHELSHVKRADFLVMLIVRTSLAVFWWNPLCWIVYRELRKEQEIACDELVLRAGIRPSAYAASLLAFRRSAGFRWNPSAALLGMLGRSSFHERLAAILKQKLIFKEVKMKTRIMLAAAVVLAVALIGTARPAVGIEKNAVTTTIMETAAPAPASFDFTAPASVAQEKQAEKVAVQEKEKEKAKAAEKAEKEKTEKEKAVIEKKIVVTTKAGTKTPIEITITEGDTVKTLVLDKPLTITSGKDGDVLVLSLDGKEFQVLKGEPLRLEIKGGVLEVIKEGKAMTIGEGGVYRVVKESGEGGEKVVVYGTEEGKPGEAKVVKVIKEGEGAKDVKVVVKTVTEAEPEIIWTIKEPGKGEDVWVAKEFSGKPVAGTWVGERGKAFAFSSARDKEMLEKVHALQEQVAAIKAKKMDIAALDESLKKLEAELQAKEEKLRALEIKIEKERIDDEAMDKIVEGKAEGDVIVYKKIHRAEAEAGESKAIVKVQAKDDGLIQIVLGETGMGREAYDRAIAKLKKDLPEGYKLLESNFDEKTAEMTFKIAPPEGKKSDEKLIRKLVDSLQAEIDKK